MTPSDIGPQYRSKLRESANFAVWSIKKTVKDNGARPAGSEQEKKAEEFVVSQVGAAADRSATEEFGVSLKIDTMRYRVNFILLLLATAAGLAGIPIAAACIALAAYLFLVCKPLGGIFCKKATSANTLITRSPSGETRRRIIFEGSADSGYEWRLKAVTMFEIIELVGILWLAAFHVFQFFTVGNSIGQLPHWYSWAALVFIPAYAILFIAVNYKVTPDGANNNLTGAYAAAAVLKFMGDNGIRFENTEVCALITGGSEQNRAGIRHYAKNHKDDLKAVDTLFISLDTLRDYESLALTSKSDKASKIIGKAAENAGVTFDASAKVTGLDSSIIAAAGVNAAAVTAKNPAASSFYRTREDTVENMNIKTIEKSIEIAVEAACLFDAEQ